MMNPIKKTICIVCSAARCAIFCSLPKEFAVPERYISERGIKMNGKNIDVDFINRIVNTYSDTILRIAYQRSGSVFDAQDIAQEVFISLMKKDLKKLSEAELRAYVIRTAINKCNDLHRRKKRVEIISIDDALPLFTPEEQTALDAVRSLPEKYRDVIYLHYYEGYKIAEIADILGEKSSAVNSRLNRAREKLRTILTEE